MAENKIATIKTRVVDVVTNKIRVFQEGGELHLPENYSAENAMKSAWLILQEVQDMNKKMALEVCTENSIANALLDMAVQGLNPAKKQCYFIVYGNKLSCQRSYFGTIAVAKLTAGVKEVYPQIVYEGDVLEYGIDRGRKTITRHEQKMENVDPSKIVAAYCVVEFEDGRPDKVEIMKFDQIKKSWRKSKMNPFDEKGNLKPGSTHEQYTEAMCLRTVINKALTPLINASSDSALLLKHFNRTDDEAIEAEIEEMANSETIDIEMETTVDTETGEVKAAPAEKDKAEGPESW